MGDGLRPGHTVHRGPAVARTGGSRVRRHAHRSLASGHSGARELTGEGAKERGEHGEPVSGLTGARVAVWRPGDGGGET
jgi:hypothetical protein